MTASATAARDNWSANDFDLDVRVLSVGTGPTPEFGYSNQSPNTPTSSITTITIFSSITLVTTVTLGSASCKHDC